jgi:hypothetical protein
MRRQASLGVTPMRQERQRCGVEAFGLEASQEPSQELAPQAQPSLASEDSDAERKGPVLQEACGFDVPQAPPFASFGAQVIGCC